MSDGRLRAFIERIEKLAAKIEAGDIDPKVAKDLKKIHAAVAVLQKYGAPAESVAAFQKCAELIRASAGAA